MKVTAKVSFANTEFAMKKGEVKEIDSKFLDDLLKCGYVVATKEKAKEVKAEETTTAKEGEEVEVKRNNTRKRKTVTEG